MSKTPARDPNLPQEPTPAQESTLQVVCSIRAERNRALLVEWLASVDRVSVSMATPAELVETPFDLCIIDHSTLTAVGEQLLDRCQRAKPVVLPCLLVATADNRGPDSKQSVVPDAFQSLVTDVVTPPIKKTQLRRRLNVLLDIRHQSTQLARSKAHHQQLLELLPEAVLVLSEGTIQYANSAAECLFGATERTLLGMRFLDYVAATDHSTATELLAVGDATEPVRRDTTATFVELALTVDGETVEIEAASTALGVDDERVQLICRDMTEQREREDQLRLYRMAMDEATIGITITDASAMDNPLVYVNQEFEKLTGLDREWMLGQNPRFAQSPRSDPETVDEIRAAIEAGEPISVEILNQRSDGTEWHNALTISPVHQDGELTHFLGFQRNVSASRAQQNQLAVLDRVLRHNLRNRLNVVLGHADTLLEGASTETVPLHAGAICETASDLLALSDKTRRFRTAIETDSESTTDIELAGIVEDCLDEISAAYPAATVDRQLEESQPVQSPSVVRFAIQELLENAINHSEGNQPHVSITLSQTDTGVEIQLVDDGPGIPEAERQAFENVTETPTDHAVGIGLWLVRWALDNVGGTLEYEPVDPHGSCITIYLPAGESS